MNSAQRILRTTTTYGLYTTIGSTSNPAKPTRKLKSHFNAAFGQFLCKGRFYTAVELEPKPMTFVCISENTRGDKWQLLETWMMPLNSMVTLPNAILLPTII